MTYEVIVLPKAKRQIRKIDAWWRENRPAAPTLFMAEFERARARLGVFPDSGRRYSATVADWRYLTLPATRYLLYYGIDAEKACVRILAIRSSRRDTQPRF